ncbi:fibronectin type III domain-containing protein, partial [Patescibacteria group bacterium]|nr:fibronectin type III domain-containing protein [Patescibacteria group bacterium]
MSSRILFSSLIYSIVGGLLLTNTSAVLAEDDNPITAPITSAITEPVTSPIIDTNPTPTPAPKKDSSGSSSNNSSGNSNGGPGQAPICGDSRPISTPKLVYAFASNKNEVTLVWTKALDPVSYYLVAYGTKPGQLEFGNPNVGNKETTRYSIGGLNGNQTYYFKVRAGNGCMPGDFSNEVAVKVSGKNISTTPAGFQAGVLGSTKKASQSAQQVMPFKPITSA